MELLALMGVGCTYCQICRKYSCLPRVLLRLLRTMQLALSHFLCMVLFSLDNLSLGCLNNHTCLRVNCSYCVSLQLMLFRPVCSHLLPVLVGIDQLKCRC